MTSTSSTINCKIANLGVHPLSMDGQSNQIDELPNLRKTVPSSSNGTALMRCMMWSRTRHLCSIMAFYLWSMRHLRALKPYFTPSFETSIWRGLFAWLCDIRETSRLTDYVPTGADLTSPSNHKIHRVLGYLMSGNLWSSYRKRPDPEVSRSMYKYGIFSTVQDIVRHTLFPRNWS